MATTFAENVPGTGGDRLTMDGSAYTSPKWLHAIHKIRTAGGIVILAALLIALSGCNGSIEPQASPEPHKPAVSEPAPPLKTVPKSSDVDVTISDSLTAGQNRSISTGTLFNAGLENTYLFYGDEVSISLHGMDGGSRLSEDDLRSRLQITPGAEFSIIVPDNPATPHYLIKIKAGQINTAEVLIRAEPTEPDAPRFQSDLRYTLRRVDEPKFVVPCAEHPEVREGVVLVVPAGKKHLTMRLTHPVARNIAQSVLEAQYRASEIRWKSDLEVDFTVDLRWGRAIAFRPPAPADTRGVADRLDTGLWGGQVVPSLLVDQPSHAVDVLPMTTLADSAITSPDGRYAVVLEKIPRFGVVDDVDNNAVMYLLDLDDGSKTPLMDDVIPYQRIFGVWSQDSTVFATAGGYSIYSGDPVQRGTYLFSTTGQTRKIALDPGQYAGVMGLAFSPTDGRLLIGLAQSPDQESGPYQLLVRMYSLDGTLLREYQAGYIQQRHTRSISSPWIAWKPDGMSALMDNFWIKDDQGIAKA